MLTLDADLRARVADEWAQDGLMEHASVASFARFTLHLLAVGAPPALVDEALQAGRDEIEHARLCFRLAQRVGGAAVGPGPLPLDGDVIGDVSLPAVVRAAVAEGCVGETVAAMEAGAALERAEDVEVRAALQIIARDEARHAELAWRFVGWAVQADAAARAAAEDAFRVVLAAPAGAPLTEEADVDRLAAWGRLTRRRRADVRAEALAEVVAPTAQALLARA
ncbi:MAG: ferritin-like domain-containing protein [Myxococcales bacterium]|nr:ferritin-like domain-containing protein [Myxococcales bacterium]